MNGVMTPLTKGCDNIPDGKFPLYCYDNVNKRITIGFGHSVRQTGKQVPVVKVLLDNGDSIRCTPNHRFMLRDGTYVEADAEVLALWSNIMRSLGIKAEIRINHRKLANAILESVQIKQKAEVMREIDKLDKIGEDIVKANLKKYADTNQIITLFKLLEKDLAFFVSNMFDGAEDIIKLRELGKKHGFAVVFDPLLVRGLSYYTGNSRWF
jgi:intein/homing endonuclease